jgi:hypothetical protein
MPTRRTSPRRLATRPSALPERALSPDNDFDDDDPPGFLAGAGPWIALLAIILALGAIAFVALRGTSEDLTACRTAAWGAIPSRDDLPASWTIGSTDLSANGMTISLLGPASADGTSQPVVVASVTCYGNSAETALDQNRKAAAAARATLAPRDAAGDAYDVVNVSTGSTTTFFRVGQLIAQVADSGAVAQADREAITTALASAMGQSGAAGVAGVGPTDDANSSLDPGSDDPGAVDPSGAPFAPELEALLPKAIVDHSSAGSPPPSIPLTTQSASATDVFGGDPNARALAARIRALGGTLDKLQIAQAFDDTGAIDLSIIAFRLPGADLAKLKSAVIDTWLSAGADGVKKTEITLGGKTVTKVDYGDGQTIEYVFAKADYVVVIDTADLDVATQAAAQLK